ncbi:MAG: carboxypeptidase-like regulatory domain-containing protein [Bryobacteraceae bacterium]
MGSAVLLVACAAAATLSGRVSDPQGKAVVQAAVRLSSPAIAAYETQTGDEGRFWVGDLAPGSYTLELQHAGFADLVQTVRVEGDFQLDLRLELAAQSQVVNVTADVQDAGVLFPDPAQRIVIREETLDANPGRPGAPVSIPGLPIETASGGIKAPQYFAPGVAGDHGEPIAQYFQIGDYLIPNNLSANAHGNGYSDPNAIVPGIIEMVQTDGGAFNVREGNHAVDLAAIYGFHDHLDPFVTLTGDYRDIDLTAGWSPVNPDTRAWIAFEAAYGNGFLDRLEHRQQYKLDGYRVFDMGAHRLTLFGAGYYGHSMVPGLVPIDVPNLHDTIDPRQKDQTHTAEIALNDVWRLGPGSDLHLSSFFRTYNLALDSDFGDGLIRQSEFRTVAGGEANYVRKVSESLTVMAGADYDRDAPRRDDLDHYLSTDPAVYGPFDKVTANNVTIGDIAPFVALDGSPLAWLHYYAGWRRDQIGMDNTDLLNPANSFNKWVGVNSPKATLSLLPPEKTFLPSLAMSFGQTFFTNDPRIGTGSTPGSPVSRAHSWQLVSGKTVWGTDFRLTLGRVTQEQSLAKLDPDTGLQYYEGPSRNRYLTASARRHFRAAFVQASVSKADARDLSDGTPLPEAPRTILDVLGTLDRLPFHLQARAEYEEVGRKPLGDGFVSVPVREFRGALLRHFHNGRMSAGINFMIASGYTGQTTEVLALPGEAEPFERVVGVYLPSYVTASYSYRFR